MNLAKRLQTVQLLAQRRERNAAGELAEVKLKLDAERQTLEQLAAYHREYTERLTNDHDRHVDVQRIQADRVFLNQLASAVERQQQTVQRAEQAYGQQQRRWSEHKRDQCVLDKAVARIQHQEWVKLERTAQQQLDEQALRKHIQRTKPD